MSVYRYVEICRERMEYRVEIKTKYSGLPWLKAVKKCNVTKYLQQLKRDAVQIARAEKFIG